MDWARRAVAGAAFAVIGATVFGAASPVAAATPERVEVRGEIIDTWCYFSGVMGGPEAVVGSSHHVCAMWCAAGGIPVGLLTEEGEVYMILKLAGEEKVTGGDTVLDLQSDVIRADGLLYERDGIKYLVVESVLANEGILKRTHEEYGAIPPMAFPDPNQ